MARGSLTRWTTCRRANIAFYPTLMSVSCIQDSRASLRALREHTKSSSQSSPPDCLDDPDPRGAAGEPPLPEDVAAPRVQAQLLQQRPRAVEQVDEESVDEDGQVWLGQHSALDGQAEPGQAGRGGVEDHALPVQGFKEVGGLVSGREQVPGEGRPGPATTTWGQTWRWHPDLA